MDCHSEIKRRVEVHSGFHGRAFKGGSGQADCARCHMEHNGQGFALVRLDRNGFDHAAATGFELTGKHKLQKCDACHQGRNLSTALRAEIKVKDVNRSYLGLSTACLNCHEDRHGGQLGADCLRCHTQEGWKSPAGFNHSSTRFPLTGLHRDLACLKCHQPKTAAAKPVYKGLTFARCDNCHADLHRGAFQEVSAKNSCERCHNTGGWKKNRAAGEFDHASTKFPLAGKHAALECQACHRDANFKRPVEHERCASCHRDPHSGQFATRAAGSDCASCHVETGFKPARFDREAHSASSFPLRGKHADVACAKCHAPAGKETVYKTGKVECKSCHEDKHSGQFAAAPLENRCSACHVETGFRLVNFTSERHRETRFPLTGKHAEAQCAACHKAEGRYRFERLDCAGCHENRHETRTACETCHTTAAWKSVAVFDHTAAAKFPLTGAHAKARCEQCHAQNHFAAASSACASCHVQKDPHGGQFQNSVQKTDCAACHAATEWRALIFEHDRTRFPLDVAHRNVTCAKCHKTANRVPVYRDTRRECVQCH